MTAFDLLLVSLTCRPWNVSEKNTYNCFPRFVAVAPSSSSGSTLAVLFDFCFALDFNNAKASFFLRAVLASSSSSPSSPDNIASSSSTRSGFSSSPPDEISLLLLTFLPFFPPAAFFFRCFFSRGSPPSSADSMSPSSFLFFRFSAAEALRSASSWSRWLSSSCHRWASSRAIRRFSSSSAALASSSFFRAAWTLAITLRRKKQHSPLLPAASSFLLHGFV